MCLSVFKKLSLGTVLCAMTSMAVAQELTLDEGPLWIPDYDNGGMGGGRGVGFHADENYSMTSFAIDLSVPAAETVPEYEFEIYSSTDGHTAGALLASTSFYLVEGEGYQPQPFVYDFVAGNYYVINFSRVDDAYLGQLGTHYSWESGYVPFDYGILTVVEGFEGATPNPDNAIVAHFRFNASVMDPYMPPVPTLSMWGLLILVSGLGLSVFMRRIKSP